MDDSLILGEGVAIKDSASSPFRLTTTTSNHEPETLKFSLMSTGNNNNKPITMTAHYRAAAVKNDLCRINYEHAGN
jgi:hypothetical protein